MARFLASNDMEKLPQVCREVATHEIPSFSFMFIHFPLCLGLKQQGEIQASPLAHARLLSSRQETT